MTGQKHTKMLPQAGGPPRRTYRGKRSVSPETGDGILAHPDIAKRLTIKELRFLDYYYQTGSKVKAFQKIYPKASQQRAAWGSGKLHKQIRGKITQDEEWELMGVSLAKIGRTVSDAMEANFQREFIDRDGDIHKGEVRPDHAVRMSAVGAAMKLRRLDKGDEGGGINVNIVLYADPREPRWPGADDNVIDVTPEEGA